MKRCPKCGALCPRPGQKFCGSCGAPLSDTPPQAGRAPAPEWPPRDVVQRRRLLMVAAVAAVLVLVVAAGVLLFVRRGAARPVDAPAQTTTAESAAQTTYTVAEENRLYLDNLLPVDGMTLTADGAALEYGVGADGRAYVDRRALGSTDVLLRAILPSGDGWQTSLALVSKPSNPTASFGTLRPCEEDGFNEPDAEYLDAMLTVYYHSQLRAFNSRNVSDLRFSTDLNDQSWQPSITTGAYDAVLYDLEDSDMTYTETGLAHGEDKVTFNAAGHWTGTNRDSGAAESGTDYMTIQAIWRDGIWQVDRCLPCTEQEYNNGTLKLSTK